MVGLRGVGKTVLLDRMRDDAEASGVHTIRIEAPEDCSLPALLAPQLRVALLRLSKLAHAKDLAVRGLRALAGFAKGLKVTDGDIEVGLDCEGEPGLADNGDLEHDLQELLESAGAAAKAAGTGSVVCIDELQYVPEQQLAALITAMHRCAHRRVPVLLVGAGLPQLRGPSPSPCRPKALKSPWAPLSASWRTRAAIHTSCRNGANGAGKPLSAPPSRPKTWSVPPRRPWLRWTRVSSAFALIG